MYVCAAIFSSIALCINGKPKIPPGIPNDKFRGVHKCLEHLYFANITSKSGIRQDKLILRHESVSLVLQQAIVGDTGNRSTLASLACSRSAIRAKAVTLGKPFPREWTGFSRRRNHLASIVRVNWITVMTIVVTAIALLENYGP